MDSHFSSCHRPLEEIIENIVWCNKSSNISFAKLVHVPLFRFEKLVLFVNTMHFFSLPLCRDLSENQIKGIPRKAFRGIVDVKNL